ncbi:L-2-hydroxyglutarate oxidase [Nocardioides gansuensis]|uniref:L-2-hydroxyglutarate oxidase n=1 Tax=Nocardioides gansuensis TaxID=2138300 RepID=A0A2T8F6M0_9ACTN|nr:L-2-hydroxyglutarate oxidase [Nocardioides gansuensis]PVG81361.1 L-2-hydroxyglutarate oxidase [Nocardioides gansuensis]
MEGVFDYVVVGGGIVGASTAWHLLRKRPGAGVLLLDKEQAFGVHQTGHNSGVIHSGIYYEPGSLKAEMCRRGARLTEEFAAAHGIPTRRTGKLLVATDEREVAGMHRLHERAGINGIEAELVDAAELARREPHVRGLGALWLPGTGITDFRLVNQALAGEVEGLGGVLRTGIEVVGVVEGTDQVVLRTAAGEELKTRRVVFCGGVQADRLARLAGLEVDFRIVPFRGEYYDVVPARADLVSTLIYPIPDPSLPFLGVHLTPTVDGGLNVGPNAVLGLAREGYRKFSFQRRDAWDVVSFPGMYAVARQHARTGARELRNSLWKGGYLKACQKYCPSLRAEDLTPREAGIRAQAVLRDGSFVHDFLLRRTPRTLHVINAPSPAATSALPIGEHLARQALDPANA